MFSNNSKLPPADLIPSSLAAAHEVIDLASMVVWVLPKGYVEHRQTFKTLRRTTEQTIE